MIAKEEKERTEKANTIQLPNKASILSCYIFDDNLYGYTFYF